MPVRKAIIPAAGMGTRFLPASKAVPKEMVTIVDRPVIQYAVEELVRAGVTDICIVDSAGKEALGDHFRCNAELERLLEKKDKTRLLEELRQLSSLAEISFVAQNEPLGLGHAVWVAREYAGGDPVVVLLPDEIIDPAENLVGEMIRTFDTASVSVVAVDQVPHASIGSYGAIEPEDPKADTTAVRSLVEKPHPDNAPSDLALIGRYVLDPSIFGILESLPPGAGGEIQLTDALAVLAGRGRLLARRFRGRRWDAGTKQGYLEATVSLALDHPELGTSFRNYLRQAGVAQ
ncbi:MAG: UTP--glucose-1-phosphate uridylyltransferase [Actinobacteria bacterium]|nr:UTP--glucose-1-phosphate uridylyltransferase [Actinomycetota bacterium]